MSTVVTAYAKTVFQYQEIHLPFKNIKTRASDTAQQIKVLTTQAWWREFNPQNTGKGRGENRFHKVVL